MRVAVIFEIERLTMFADGHVIGHVTSNTMKLVNFY